MSRGVAQLSDEKTKKLETAIEDLATSREAWNLCSIFYRKEILNTIKEDFLSIAEEWVNTSLKNKGIEEHDPAASDEWISGPFPIIRYIRLLYESLNILETTGRPKIPGPITTRKNGQITVQIFPQTLYDQLFYGTTYEVWMQPSETIETLKLKQAQIYKTKTKPRLTLILGSGNFSAQSAMDILYYNFIKNHVAIYKTNPVNSYLHPLLDKALNPLIEIGALRIVDGGAAEGAYLTSHAMVEEIHLTGSNTTYKAIKKSLEKQKDTTQKKITAELGNVGPFIIVPGPWSNKEVEYHAEHLVSTIINNAGFNCSTPRILITDSNWDKRQQFLDKIRSFLNTVPLRNAFYPGAMERYANFLKEHPEAEKIGVPKEGELPWTLITNVPTENDDICFEVEPFCSILSETALSSKNTADFLNKAIWFANEKLNGSLVATLIIDPQSQKESSVSEAFDKAVADLKYGTIGVNYWGGASYLTGVTPWGAFQNSDGVTSKSGIGVVNNALMLADTQKTVLRAPFIIHPKPAWFVSKRKNTTEVFRKLTYFEANPSLWKVPSILWSALKT